MDGPSHIFSSNLMLFSCSYMNDTWLKYVETSIFMYVLFCFDPHILKVAYLCYLILG
jgi:hypothetical protein